MSLARRFNAGIVVNDSVIPALKGWAKVIRRSAKKTYRRQFNYFSLASKQQSANGKQPVLDA
jgi:hypothetical protein